jgi:hypothetical protein
MHHVPRSLALDPRVVSAALALLLVPIDVSHGEIPWQYNTLCDWATTTLLSVACGQTLAVCVVRRRNVRWWVAFAAIFSLHFFDLLYGLLLSLSWLLGNFTFPRLMGASSGILGLLFIFTSAAFIIYHYVLASAVRAAWPVWEQLLRAFLSLSLSVVSLLICIRLAPGDTRLRGGADTVLYFGARALIPYCFWSCILYPSRSFSSYFNHAAHVA